MGRWFSQEEETSEGRREEEAKRGVISGEVPATAQTAPQFAPPAGREPEHHTPAAVSRRLQAREGWYRNRRTLLAPVFL